MNWRMLLYSCAALGLISPASAQPKEKGKDKARTPVSEAVLKEFQRFQGNWTLESQELDGKAAKPEQVKARVLFCGSDVFLIRKGTELLQIGVMRIDPSKSPKTVSATISKGLYQGETMLGIYEIDGDTLKFCFEIEGQNRPTEFKTSTGEGRFLAVYKRVVPPANEGDDITGNYDSVSIDAEGKKHLAKAEISRHGNAYMVKYLNDGELDYIGIGLRRGDVVSVCWTNRGGVVGISVYSIKKDGSMEGDYTELGGIGIVNRETLTRKKTAK